MCRSTISHKITFPDQQQYNKSSQIEQHWKLVPHLPQNVAVWCLLSKVRWMPQPCANDYTRVFVRDTT